MTLNPKPNFIQIAYILYSYENRSLVPKWNRTSTFNILSVDNYQVFNLPDKEVEIYEY